MRTATLAGTLGSLLLLAGCGAAPAFTGPSSQGAAHAPHHQATRAVRSRPTPPVNHRHTAAPSSRAGAWPAVVQSAMGALSDLPNFRGSFPKGAEAPRWVPSPASGSYLAVRTSFYPVSATGVLYSVDLYQTPTPLPVNSSTQAILQTGHELAAFAGYAEPSPSAAQNAYAAIDDYQPWTWNNQPGHAVSLTPTVTAETYAASSNLAQVVVWSEAGWDAAVVSQVSAAVATTTAAKVAVYLAGHSWPDPVTVGSVVVTLRPADAGGGPLGVRTTVTWMRQAAVYQVSSFSVGSQPDVRTALHMAESMTPRTVG